MTEETDKQQENLKIKGWGMNDYHYKEQKPKIKVKKIRCKRCFSLSTYSNSKYRICRHCGFKEKRVLK